MNRKIFSFSGMTIAAVALIFALDHMIGNQQAFAFRGYGYGHGFGHGFGHYYGPTWTDIFQSNHVWNERRINCEIFEGEMKEMWENKKNRNDGETLEQFWERTKLSPSRRILLDNIREGRSEGIEIAPHYDKNNWWNPRDRRDRLCVVSWNFAWNIQFNYHRFTRRKRIS